MTRWSAGLLRVACVLVLFGAMDPAAAQPLPTFGTGFDACKQWTIDQIEKFHVKLRGAVECTRGDMQIFADELEAWTDTHRVVLTGNVTFRQRDMQISADRAELNTETGLGTFFNAYGFATLAERAKLDAMGGQEPDVYFRGEKIQRIGKDKYKITHGGFTTCVQPTPRWQITSGSVTLRLDHYAVLLNAVIQAKGVPVFYLPALFYPIKKNDRATGILMPTFGTSTVQGFTLSNAFFWAISRSQDATFMHDWFAARGQGMGAEYRFVSSPGSSGFFRFYRLQERASTAVGAGGSTTSLPRRTSYEVRSSVRHALGRGWTARGRIDYFTDITAQQAYNTDIFDASRSTRTLSGGIGGPVKGFTINAAYDRTEYFSGLTDSSLIGGTPRVTFSRDERPLFGAVPIYFSMGGEYTHLLRTTRSAGGIGDRSLTRFDLSPTIRIPFTKLRFLTVNSSVAFRETRWSRSLDPTDGAIVDVPVGRQYFDLQSRITGPVVNRVWNTPNNGYADKWKHSIEPFMTVQRITMVDNFSRIVQSDGTDMVLGGTTRVNYGVTNRILAKRRVGEGVSSAREILSVGVTQSFYTDARASQYDLSYSNSYSGWKPSNFSPIRVTARASPGDQVNGSFRMEYDRSQKVIQSLAADGQVAVGDRMNVSVGYSRSRTPTIASLLQQRNNFLNATAHVRTEGNRLGGSYTLNYDLGRSALLNSRIIGYYNAQCCGFAIEYQTFTLSQLNPALPVKQDHRFNFSFTLAGLGTFSNFFGALGGTPR